MSRFASLLLLTVMGSGWIAQPAAAQVWLQFQYKPGNSFGMTVSQDMTSTSHVQGRDIKTSMKQTIQIETEVEKQSSSQAAWVKQTIQRVQTKMTLPGVAKTFEYDSAAEDNTNAPSQFATIMDKIVGGTFQLEIAPSGKVLNIKIPDDFLKSLPGQGAGFLSQDGLKQMVSQGSVVFPETPIKKGDQWDNKLEMKMPFGKMKIHQKNTYQGTNDDGLHVIGIDLDMSLVPDENQPFKMTIKESTSEGTMLFDNRIGRLIKSKIIQKMTIEMEIQGQTIEQEINQVILVETGNPSSSR